MLSISWCNLVPFGLTSTILHTGSLPSFLNKFYKFNESTCCDLFVSVQANFYVAQLLHILTLLCDFAV